MKNKQKTIYDLELHEELLLKDKCSDSINVLRVHGGFIYSHYEFKNGEVDEGVIALTSTFVPYTEPKKLNERSPISGKILD